jgi:hypothetical protein
LFPYTNEGRALLAVPFLRQTLRSVITQDPLGLLDQLPCEGHISVRQLWIGSQRGCAPQVVADTDIDAAIHLADMDAMLGQRSTGAESHPIVVSGMFDFDRGVKPVAANLEAANLATSPHSAAEATGRLHGAPVERCVGLIPAEPRQNIWFVGVVVNDGEDEYALDVIASFETNDGTTSPLPQYEGYNTAQNVVRKILAKATIEFAIQEQFLPPLVEPGSKPGISELLIDRIDPTNIEDWQASSSAISSIAQTLQEGGAFGPLSGDELEAYFADQHDEAVDAEPEVHVAAGWPPPRLVKTAAAAEAYAAEVMRALGFSDARATGPGADGGIDVVSSRAVAQVKMEAILTGRPVLQGIKGVAAVEKKRAIVFSLAGFTQQAVAWADRADVACFEFAFDGSIDPRSIAALALMAETDLS